MLLPLVVVSLLSASSSFVSAHEHLRISRAQPASASGNTVVRPVHSAAGARKPLTGGVDYTTAGSLIDVDQFKGSVQPPKKSIPALRDGVNRQGPQPLQSEAPALEPFARIPASAKQTQLQGDLSKEDLKLLSRHDVIVMQDRSTSMGEKEYFPSFGRASRWQWCLNQARDLTRQTAGIPDWAITLILFSSKYDIHQRVTLQDLPAIFVREGIFIGTRLADPVAEALSDYFNRRAAGKVRPLIIAIVTDGKPQDEENLRDVIINATQQLNDRNEVRITFLQVGTDHEGQKKLGKLNYRLVTRGARYDIVDVVPFYQVAQQGLARALVDAIRG